MAAAPSERPPVATTECRRAAAQHWIWTTTAISVVAFSSTVICSFHKDCLGMRYASLYLSKLDQCNYAIEFIPELQL